MPDARSLARVIHQIANHAPRSGVWADASWTPTGKGRPLSPY